MRNGFHIKRIITRREFQITIVLGIIAFALKQFMPWIKIIRLTPQGAYRPFFLLLEPARVIGVITSCIAGPTSGLILAFFSINPSSFSENGNLMGSCFK